eukprot:TRINITY_DN3957_c0_g1_i4.p1 TRINITY_DN3957_c0_g1~~TRINITY_DN3957_c0_g1_i4.p1  ORF type:complete len:150 (+),score=18.10 TRINITY_DN3957_c0_g1_i4:64-513(+)
MCIRDRLNINNELIPDGKQPDQKSLEYINNVYDVIRCIRHPEHPHTIDFLNIVQKNQISFRSENNLKLVVVNWQPLRSTCKFALHVGFAIRLKLEREFKHFENIKIEVLICEGGHRMRDSINRVVNDKERYQAAKENSELITFVETLMI